jgi:hypothetical protein
VLSWIKTPPKEFRPFVSARVAEIQETVGSVDFRYIRSSDNPADALTRGFDPERLTDIGYPVHHSVSYRKQNGQFRKASLNREES